jgi:hypothetical protein
LAFVRWIVVAVVPAPALEPVSLHFRQPWQALLVVAPKPKNKRALTMTQAWLTVCAPCDIANR